MDHSRTTGDDEVIDQPAVGVHGLRPHSARTRADIGGPYAG